MGSGTWSARTYRKRADTRRESGKDTFEYSHEVKRTGNLKVHPTLDPQGLKVRESRDNDEHPDSNAIIIGLDETGSMERVIRAIHGNLPQLLDLLLKHTYVPHPQIMFAAVGDASSDMVPLQVGQFESDNRMDENLENMILEGNGGPYGMESYDLLLYVAARHTVIDCWEKRRRKGYLFLIGDEMAYPGVKRDQVNKLIGSGLQDSIALNDILAEIRDRYHLYFIIPAGAAGGDNPQVFEFWKSRLGAQYVIKLDNPEDVSRTIALTIGLSEGTIQLDDGISHLRELGATEGSIGTVSKALSQVKAVGGLAKGTSLSDLTPPDKRDDEPRTRRL